MECEYEFCVYNKDNKCCTEPRIGVNGFCDSCILVDVGREYLDNIKERILNEWDKDEY